MAWRSAGATFTSGRPASHFTIAWAVDLYLSCESEGAYSAAEPGIDAATLARAPAQTVTATSDVHFALRTFVHSLGEAGGDRVGISVARYRVENRREPLPHKGKKFGAFDELVAEIKTWLDVANSIRSEPGQSLDALIEGLKRRFVPSSLSD